MFKCIGNASNGDVSGEMKEVGEHLVRAGYDALELLAGTLGSAIIEKMAAYETASLTQVFPQYYQTIRPQLTDIKMDLSALRAKKEPNDVESSFIAYFERIKEMIAMGKEIDKMIPLLEEYEAKRKIESRNSRIWQLAIAVASALIASFITYLALN